MTEQTREEQTLERAKVLTRDNIKDIGLHKFNEALGYATGHISHAAHLLRCLDEDRKKVMETVHAIQQWRSDCESKLKNVPELLVEVVRVVFKASEDEMNARLQQIAEEMMVIDLDATPPEEIAF